MISLAHISLFPSLQTPLEIKDVSFSIKQGEIFGIVGPENSGKSLLLKMINGLIAPSIGTVEVFNESICAFPRKKLSRLRKEITFVQRKPVLLPHLTLLENILLPLENMEKEQKEACLHQASPLLDFLDLQGLATAYPDQLSPFACYKCTLARALITSPKVLLIENVGVGLSQPEKELLFTYLENINFEKKTSIVISTSDADIMKQLCHRAAIMIEGALLALGDPFTLISAPSHPQVIAFLSKQLAFDLPKEVQEHAYGTIVLIEYTGETANEPILYEVSQRFGVEYNILQGRIEYIRGKPLGKMYVSFNSEPALMPAVLDYLSQNTHNVEVIQHV
ncbi:MAG: ATP-binding cassette domain-containing protein [Clostridiales bacterium]|nr:ATP-binding cassette domain-containing protein [Clostridiales bacterium]